MSRALAVFHGRFGRATVYQLNRPFNIHAHREGHLIFHVGGRSACIDVSDGRYELTEGSVVAINPWEPHNFLPSDLDGGAVFFVLLLQVKPIRWIWIARTVFLRATFIFTIVSALHYVILVQHRLREHSHALPPAPTRSS